APRTAPALLLAAARGGRGEARRSEPRALGAAAEAGRERRRKDAEKNKRESDQRLTLDSRVRLRFGPLWAAFGPRMNPASPTAYRTLAPAAPATFAAASSSWSPKRSPLAPSLTISTAARAIPSRLEAPSSAAVC